MNPDQPHDDRDVSSADPSTLEGERIADDRPRPTPLWALLSRWLLAVEAWLRSHGGTPLQYGIRGFWTVVAVGGIVLLFGPVINKPMTLDDITSSATNSSDRWIAREFSVDYAITRADDGTLHARVEERIDAFFPEDVNERGIQRVLATEYQGHALAPSNVAATFDGVPLEVERSSTTDQLTLVMNTAERLQGDHEFVLRYELRHLAYETTDQATGQPVQLLEWDVFGPSWPQGFSGIDVRVTLPEDIDDQLVRQPRGSVAWAILGGGVWLEPEADSPAGQVTYRFSNDQNTPPNAQAWFTMHFAPGTFSMPAPTTLFWVQTFGPIAPLAFLVITLLLALAARAVAWSDERGRPWFVAQYEPPRNVSPAMAAHVLRAPLALELAQSLRRGRKKKDTGDLRERKIAIAHVARRAGRIGDVPRALSRYLKAPEGREQVRTGLRRIPRGFVRDLFIAAPLALTLVQWGLVRQLSYQAKLAVVWWPVAFVLTSSVVAIIVLAIALSARPLTRAGALLRQHLLGIGVYAERTHLLDRAQTDDRLLPYAVLLSAPREAGERVAALVEAELGEAGVSSRWRTKDFLSGPRLTLRMLSLLILVGAIAMVATVPNPYSRSHSPTLYYGDIPGNIWTKVESVDTTAELTRTEAGHARIDVTERWEVLFDENPSRVPQVAQQWPNRIDGQDLGLTIERVLIDGEEVPYAVEADGDTLLMRTTLGVVLTGLQNVRIDYSLTSAAVAAHESTGAGGRLVDRVRWQALLRGWEHNSQWGADPPIDPLRFTFRLSDELAAQATTAGWVSRDPDSAESPREWEESAVPFGTVESSAADDATSESDESRDGVRSYTLDLRQDEYGAYPSDLTRSGVGVAVDFPVGTFTGTDEGSLRSTQFVAAVPLIAVLALGATASLIGAAVIVARVRRRSIITESGLFRDTARWVAPASTLGAVVLFVWTTGDMPADHSAFPPLAAATVAGLVLSVTGLIIAGRRATWAARPPHAPK